MTPRPAWVRAQGGGPVGGSAGEQGGGPSGRARAGRIVLLTGERGAGKTTTCRQLVARARALGLTCAGFVCPARFADDIKVGIDIEDARTGRRRALAEIDELPAAVRVGPFRFDESAVAWGRELLARACPCDLLVVDEIGPLEMEQGEGWANALDVLRGRRYRLAVAVVRPSLVETVMLALRSPVEPAPDVWVIESGPTAVDELATYLPPFGLVARD